MHANHWRQAQRRGTWAPAGHQGRAAIGCRCAGRCKGRSQAFEPAEASDTGKRQARLRAEIENLTDAIAAGALKSSPAIAARLAKAEQELVQLEASASGPKPAEVLPGFVDKYRAAVSELETILSPDGLNRGIVSDRDIARARTQLRNYLGGAIIVTEGKKKSASRPRRAPMKWRCAWPEADRKFLW
jgi:hypothetical protein